MKLSVMENMEFRIKSTLLSQKPREESLLIALLSVMVLLSVSLLCWRDPSLLNLLAASQHQVVGEQEYWRLLTTTAIHADLTHFLSNSLLFAFFSFLLYGYFGFWVFPVAVLALGSLTNYLSLLTYPENTLDRLAVSRRVNSPRFDDPQCLLAEPEQDRESQSKAKQGDLFRMDGEDAK